LAALAGISVASGALVGLFISEHTPLFGLMEHGYRHSGGRERNRGHAGGCNRGMKRPQRYMLRFPD